LVGRGFATTLVGRGFATTVAGTWSMFVSPFRRCRAERDPGIECEQPDDGTRRHGNATAALAPVGRAPEMQPDSPQSCRESGTKFLDSPHRRREPPTREETIMRHGTLRTTLRAGAILGVALLAACGTDPNDRTQGGAAAGAGTGAAFGLIGGPVGVVVGAVIGGGAGALAGASTKPQDVNLGRPPWSNAN
jgi:hypothetical protein